MGDSKHVMIEEPSELAECVEQIAGCERFGFDTEFVGEDSYHPHLCLIQVATEDRLYLIDPLTVGPLDAFWKLMLDPTREVVTHAGREEIRLCKHFIGKPPANLFDLQIAAGFVGLPYPLGHGSLVQQVLGIRLAKGETRTEWRNRPLTRDQIRYALDDVRHLLPIHARLRTRLEDLQRGDWVREECQRLISASVRDRETGPTVERWRKLRGIGTFDRRRLALVRALFEWRESRAETYNRPPRSILRDDLLVEVARKNPKRPEDLQVIRGLAKRDVQTIFDVLAQARELASDDHPEIVDREPEPPQVAWITNMLLGVLGAWSIRHQLAANLVATSADVRALVRARLGADGETGLITQGWRSVHVLPLLRDIIDGKSEIRIADPTSESPFEVIPRPGHAEPESAS